ncbi:MAG: hypothetical protein COB02_09540 [Candidatus Cloacimonadota bacterium]|nr:MAG: hypothetical protein COB02_09540 [Candidatus Cloacimonadota bacterium]
MKLSLIALFICIISSNYSNDTRPSLRSRIKELMQSYQKRTIIFNEQYRPNQKTPTHQLQSYIEYYLRSLQYPFKIISEESDNDDLYIQYQLPSWVNLRFLNKKLSRDILSQCIYKSEISSSEVEQYLDISLGYNKKIQISFSKDHARAQVAIIVDDMGYRGKGYQLYKKIPLSVTFAILPFYEQSKLLAKESFKLGYELMLHMPMQPAKGRAYFSSDNIIKEGLTAEQIKSRIKSAISSIPYIQGINNHQGSLATSNQMMMDSVMSQVINHSSQLYFIDSLTSSKSVAYKTAKKIGIPTLKRSFAFLDNDKDINKIKNKLNKLIKTSYKKKLQIAIMHEKRSSAQALIQMIQSFKDADIEIVSPSDILY